MQRAILFAAGILVAGLVHGQLYLENFNDDPAGTGVSGSPSACAETDPTLCDGWLAPPDGNWTLTGQFYSLADGNDFVRVVSNQLRAQDTDGTLCFTTAAIPLTGVAALDVQFDYRGDPDNDPEELIAVSLRLDGTVVQPLTTLAGPVNTSELTFSESGISVAGYQSVVLEICLSVNTGNEQLNIDNVLVTAGQSGPATYYSVSSGDWEDAGIWNSAPDGSGFSQTYDPNWHGADAFVIQPGHALTINDNATVEAGQLTVSSGGSLALVNSGAVLRMGDGNPAGPDLLIEGTFENNASSGNGVDLTGGATYQLGPSAVIRHTNNGPTAWYRDGFEGGVGNMPASAEFNYVYRGNPLSVVAVGMVYPNLRYLSESGHYDAQDFSAVFQGVGDGMTVLGDFSIGTAGGSVEVYYNNVSSQPLLVQGRLEIGPGSTLTTASFDHSCNHARGDGRGLEVLGDLYLSANATLEVSAASAAGSGSGCAAGRRILHLSGGTEQFIQGASGSTITVDQLTITKNGWAGVETNTDLRIGHTLALEGGIVTTGPARVILENDDPGAITGSPGSQTYIHGTLEWRMAAGGFYTFPLGEPGSACGYAPFSIAFTGAAPPYLAGSFASSEAAVPPGEMACEEGENPVYTYDYGCAYGDWLLQGSAAGAYTFDLSVDPCVYQCAGVYQQLARAGAMTDGCPVGTTARFDDFGQFTVLGADLRVLPVTLATFTARATEEGILLHWRTIDEAGHDHFLLEHSADAIKYEPLARFPAGQWLAGPRDYYHLDTSPWPGDNYYRLRQVDVDETTETYGPVVARWLSVAPDLAVHPVPAQDWLRLERPLASELPLTFTLLDPLGRVFLQGTLSDGETKTTLAIDHLPAGTYLLHWQEGKASGWLRWLKQ
ncbi:MAG: hypothetical protein KDC54_20040 [Lewinella sp.]|nr:hypothetical protein [Lewinella sp.]